ncbi:hypothetical protein LX36DRAFT_333425 [Colletotrichum falcatum]|nr:hypothetical protein LX36DRAFT_333425 [Colletotrichum falcatum]
MSVGVFFTMHGLQRIQCWPGYEAIMICRWLLKVRMRKNTCVHAYCKPGACRNVAFVYIGWFLHLRASIARVLFSSFFSSLFFFCAHLRDRCAFLSLVEYQHMDGVERTGETTKQRRHDTTDTEGGYWTVAQIAVLERCIVTLYRCSLRQRQRQDRAKPGIFFAPSSLCMHACQGPSTQWPKQHEANRHSNWGWGQGNWGTATMIHTMYPYIHTK